MCIVFLHIDSPNSNSDYKLILISNRDEYYDRPAQKMNSWAEDASIYGGRDLQPGCENGTWLAVSTSLKKIGILLNLPGMNKQHAHSRGKIVENFVKSDLSIKDFIESMKDYFLECNDFVLVTVDYGVFTPVIHTYSNATNELKVWNDRYMGFGNCLPDTPLKKVQAGKSKLQEICNKYNKINDREKLIEELICVLKSEERNLPDPQLEQRQPQNFKELSSIFVKIPHGRYGTRAHTIILVTKTGKMDLIEISMSFPIDAIKPSWERSEFRFETPV
ncbi:unnamed protein product [Parnassius apollo]|uniref:(apollo) hypothetical protein n=1 Tax=Parnassius apollo TaxID=110799 RepID=A0A8S3Y2U0_PARAO|nr:unnamed protein product [Parnassius apollo]